jgi:hypothetical protein
MVAERRVVHGIYILQRGVPEHRGQFHEGQRRGWELALLCAVINQ